MRSRAHIHAPVERVDGAIATAVPAAAVEPSTYTER
jgi:hypothetical protein